MHFLSINRLMKAFGYSLEGLRAAIKEEAAFQLEVVVSALLTVVTFFLHIGVLERTLLISSLLLVLIVELLNSAIESLTDRISTELHPLSKKIKDVSSAAVLLAILLACILWGAVILFTTP